MRCKATKNEQQNHMIYPKNFESKIGFDEIRSQLKAVCLSTLGKSLVDELAFVTDASQVNTWMEEIREMRRIGEEGEDFPLSYFFDVRESVKRVRLEGTWMDITL
jgi:DNA mismatch repair protein MutS2